MDFPPVVNLISATFDNLNHREPPSVAKAPPRAVQPVATADSVNTSESIGANSPASSGTNRVGAVLNAVA